MDLFSSEPVTGSLTGDAAPPANPRVPPVSSVPIGRPGTAEFVSIEAALAVAELGRLVYAESSLVEVLEKVADTARTVIPGAEEVSVTLVVNDRPETAGFTGPLALALDERQYAAGFGPCLDAARGGELMIVEDMATENRWPRYAPAALELGARSSLSVPLPVLEHVVGALNVYATRAGVFDAEAARLGTVLAGYAAVAVANARVFLATADAAEGMRQAMASRAVIEQAKGIVMARLGCSADEAFGHLSKASQHANRKLRDVAAEMVAAVQARRGR